MMLITFKLYASLTDYLPVDRRNGNAMPLDLPTRRHRGQTVARFALPMKLVHLVLINGVYVPPGRARHPAAGRRRDAGHLAAHRRRLSALTMFPPGVAMAFEREYGCTEPNGCATCPRGSTAGPGAGAPSRARVTLHPGQLHLQWSKLPPRRIALLNMPRLQVGFRFEAVDAPLRQQFMKRFDLVLQRGGG
jgi:hypothetical protein